MSAKRSTAVLAVAALLFAGLVGPARAQGNQPKEEEIGLLFAQTAPRGTFRPAESEGRFTLTLHGVARQVVWFSDSPARQSGHIPIRGFVREWAGFGFVEDPPNAALTLMNATNESDTVVVELGAPRYLEKTRGVRYPATLVGEASGNLSHLEHARDETIPRRFRKASLFIDDATGSVIGGCLIQAWAYCPDADLAGADLTGATLTAANLFGANLARANLTGADLFGVDFTMADLTGANLTRANLTGATFCQTTMPDGTVNNRDCTGGGEHLLGGEFER